MAKVIPYMGSRAARLSWLKMTAERHGTSMMISNLNNTVRKNDVIVSLSCVFIMVEIVITKDRWIG